ncbi:MAG: hypothetical protein ACTSRU_19905, partial [Candidatus Hodarchaeales archaeon]
RAGRRGIDDLGYTVSVLNPPVKAADIRELVHGKAADLESQFTLSYSSIANHFSSRTEEEIMKILEKSFGQFLYQESVDNVYSKKKAKISGLKRKIDSLAIKCKNGCNNESVGDYSRLKQKLINEKRKYYSGPLTLDDTVRFNRNFKNYFVRGRLVGMKSPAFNPSLAIIMDPLKPAHAKDRIKYLKVMDINGKVKKVHLNEITHGTNIICPDAKQARRLNKVVMTFLRSVSRELRDDDFIPLSSIIREIESFLLEKDDYNAFLERKRNTVHDLADQLRKHPLRRCPDFESHLADFRKIISLREEIRRTASEMKKVRIIHSRNFKNRLRVMQRFDYLDRDKYLTEKGRFLANIFDDNEILLVESLLKGIFQELDIDEVAALLGLFVVMSNDDPLLYFPKLDNPRLRKAINRIKGISRSVRDIEKQERVSDKITTKIVFNPGFVQLVYLWSSGVELSELMHETNMSEGNIISNLRRLVDLLQQIGTATRACPFDVGFDSYWVMERILRSHVRVDL